MTKKLTPEQKEIVKFHGTPLRVLAGPGTGKTMCLVEKARYLVKEQKIPYTQITLVTFARATAGELRARIERSGIDSDKLPYVNTLHGLAMNILKKNISKTDLKPNFQPVSSALTNILMNDVVYELKQKGASLSRSQVNTLREAHFRQKASAKLSAKITSNKKYIAMLSQFSNVFHEHLKFYNAVDWADVLIKALDLLDNEPEVKKDVHATTKYFLVDEYQDLNPLEQEFIDKISSDKSSLCVVGDDDQSIYETFRFANPKGLIDFIKKYPKAKSLPMSVCWRCPPVVVKAALKLIKNNKVRANKDLKAAKKKKRGFVVCLSHKSKKREIEWLVTKVNEIKGKKYKYEDIMVLFTDGKIAKDYISRLQKEKIPLNIQLKTASIFESEAFLNLYYTMKVLVDPSNNLSIRYCLHNWKGIGPETVRQLRFLSVSLKLNLWEVIEKVSKNIDAHKDIRNRNRVGDFYIFLKTLFDIKKYAEMNKIYSSKFPESKNDKGCEIFFESLNSFKNKESVVTLKEIFEDFENKVESGELENKYREEKDGVKIMTMHSAKGCESPIVIIPALEEDIIPGLAKNIEEKRRLFYVSITRAKVGVYLNWASQRTGQEIHVVKGRRMLSKKKSRFLEEIGF